MLTVDFKSKNVMLYEKANTTIYNVIGYSTYLAVEFLKIATGCFEDEESVLSLFDKLKSEKGGVIGVVDYLIEECEVGGFFTYLTGDEVKKVAKNQMVKAKTLSLLSEEEKSTEAMKMVMEKLNSGIKNLTK